MTLERIIQDSGIIAVKGSVSKEITLVCNDSRKVIPGSLFIAVKGFANDGHDYIAAAVEKGACAIVYEDREKVLEQLDGIEGSEDTTLIEVGSARYALAMTAANFYDNPSHKLTLVGITGTNGKTTTVTLLHRMFTAMGYSCGLLSTIANYVGTKGSEAINTTSDPLTINSLLNDMVNAGCEYCFMEVSSIGVEQERVAGLKFKVGIFSNLTHDHLDYHKTFAEYLRCKKLFFDMLPSDAFAITNIDDRNGMVMMQNTKAKVVTYSLRSIADHTCRIMEKSFEGMLLKIDSRESWTPLIGQHNAYNLLAIYTTAMVLGAKEEEVLVALSSLRPAPGRLEIAPFSELICVFGCGGDRDRSKRPEMAQVAQKLADRIIVTSDNSRTEKTADIMADIKSGMDISGRARSLFIEDREEAIRTAIMIAGQGATILLAGKGHETYQITGKEKRHFDEKEIVNEVFNEMN